MYIKNFLSILVFCSLSLAASEVLNSEDQELTSFNASQLHLGQDEGVESFGLQIRLGEKDDMIYPNLLWHYRMGCRNFEIVHQGLSESQEKKIKMFYDRVIDNCSLNVIPLVSLSSTNDIAALLSASTLRSAWRLQLTDRQILCLHEPLQKILEAYQTATLSLPSCLYQGFDPQAPVSFWPQTDERLIYRSSINYEQSVSLLNRTSSGDAEISNAAHIATFTTMDEAVPFSDGMVRDQLPMMGVVKEAIYQKSLGYWNYWRYWGHQNDAQPILQTHKAMQLTQFINEFGANPSMHFSDKFIYIQTPKCGCSSISRALASYEANRPLDFVDLLYINKFPEKAINFYKYLLSDKFFRFTCVRNPFNRALSGFLDKIYRGKEHHYRDELGLSKEKIIYFSDFLKALRQKPIKKLDTHFKPQWCLTMFPAIHYNKILHLENFNQEFQEVMDYLNIPGKPNDYKYDEHATKASSKLSEHYTQECVDLVLEIYGRDFECFGYSKTPNFSLTIQDVATDSPLRDIIVIGRNDEVI